MGIFHRRNGIALIVLLSMMLTVVMLVLLKPSTQLQYIVFSVIICTLFMIPSVMYYMLIINYKKTIVADVIPKITISLTKTLQSMFDCNNYTPKQKEIIGQVASETVITSVLKKHSDTIDDIGTIIHSIKDVDPKNQTEKELENTYGIVNETSLIPAHAHDIADKETREIIDKTKIVSKQQVGEVEQQAKGIDFSQLQARALARKARMDNIDIETQIPKYEPIDDSSAFKRELQSVTYTFNQKNKTE